MAEQTHARKVIDSFTAKWGEEGVAKALLAQEGAVKARKQRQSKITAAMEMYNKAVAEGKVSKA